MNDLVAFPSPAWLAALRARGRDPAFAAARRALDDRLAGYHRVLPDLPVRQAGYYHEYFCPTHAVQLVFDPREPHRHPCPVDGEVFSGEPFDSAWGWSVNDQLSEAALGAAVRHAMGASEAPGARAADAALVRHVLAGYAERYRTACRWPQSRAGAHTAGLLASAPWMRTSGLSACLGRRLCSATRWRLTIGVRSERVCLIQRDSTSPRSATARSRTSRTGTTRRCCLWRCSSATTMPSMTSLRASTASATS